MKKLIASLLFAISAYSYHLPSGTYQLSGSSSRWSNGYQGEVIIQPQGENYSLRWRIGSSQSQIGIGILNGNVLSVAYLDEATRVFGVVSYRLVDDGVLEGKWSTIDGTTQKPEFLAWKNYFTF
ncbi:MAG: hypothetical protein KGJ02_03510 [Verrucomicrobiota bacterium]|nr:hypothetical protein [Verrucomicrobiota bacterium]